MNKYPKVTFTHYRVPTRADAPRRGRPDPALLRPKQHLGGVFTSPRGGKTICRIDFGGGRYSIGEAVCSMSDNFNYKTGRILALARAMELLDPVTKTAIGSVL